MRTRRLLYQSVRCIKEGRTMARQGAKPRGRRPLSTSGQAEKAPTPPAAPEAPVPPGGNAAAAEAEQPSKWERRLKLAGAVLVPIAIPSGFVAAVVYDHEFRESVDERFPEIVDYVRKKVGFQEDLRKRARELEKDFISTQPVGVTLVTADGALYEEVVSPLSTVPALIQSLRPLAPVADLEFGDISDQPIDDPSISDPLAAPDSSDARNVVPEVLRGRMVSSLWDMQRPSVIQKAKKSDKDTVVDELQERLRDLDEAIASVKSELKLGSDRAVDDVNAELQYLKQQRGQVAADLRRNGKWWVF